MVHLFNRLARQSRAPRPNVICESLEDRRLLSAAGHAPGLKIHGVAHLNVVQGQNTSMVIATITGSDTSTVTPSDLGSGGTLADVQWGSGKSAVHQRAMIDTTAQSDEFDVVASNPLPFGIHTLHVTATNNGKRVGAVTDRIRVEKKTPNGVELHAIAGAPMTAVLGYLENALPADQQLIVDWGDQSSASSPQISTTTAGLNAVSATHTYDKPGTYVIKVERQRAGLESTLLFFPYDIISTITVSRR